MSRQISFFQSEVDAVRFIQEVENCGGKMLIDGAFIAPSSAVYTVLNKMQTKPSKFKIVPRQFEVAWIGEIFRTIEFNICCRHNKLSRTYDIGRLYIVRNDDGHYCEETVRLYDELVKYIKKFYHYDKKSRIYFAEDFWGKYCVHYYYAVCGNRPILI